MDAVVARTSVAAADSHPVEGSIHPEAGLAVRHSNLAEEADPVDSLLDMIEGAAEADSNPCQSVADRPGCCTTSLLSAQKPSKHNKLRALSLT